MKRLISLLLALALLLGGCVRRPDPSTPFSDLLVPDHLPDPPAQPAAPQAAGDPLPSSGVWVDESAYTPRSAIEAKFTRPEGDLSVFTPGTGPVYPYCAGENQYGFCTAGGVLVTDPIYEQIGLIYRGDSDGKAPPVYAVIPHPETPDGMVYRGAVAADGSFVIDCRYDSILLDGQYYECSFDEFHAQFDLYDRQGTFLLSARGLDCTFSDDFPAALRGELFRIYEFNPSYSEYYYVSADGRRLGPYRSAGVFSEGLACVSEDGSRFGYIDETGAWAITPRYNISFSGGTEFRDGRAIQNTDDGDVLIDRAGNILLACHTNHMSRTGDGVLVLWDDGRRYYDLDGNERPAQSAGAESDAAEGSVVYDRDATDFIFHRTDDPELEVRMPLSKFYSEPSSGAVYAEGQFLRAFISDDYENLIRHWVSVDLRHSGSMPLPAYLSPGLSGYWNGFFRPPFAGDILYDLLTDEPYYPVFEADRVLLFDADGTLLWTVPPTAKMAVVGGRLGVATDRDFAYYEPDGSVSFRFPYFVTLGD